MTASRNSLLLAVAGLLFLSGCAGTLPERTGYDRATGTWKKKHGVGTPAPSPTGSASEAGRQPAPSAPADASTLVGMASWYGSEAPNAKTASGEEFVPSDKTAAHRTLPFGTKVRVRYPKKNTEVLVRVNDRGPFKGDRIIDLSEGAAETLGLKADGVGEVWLDVQP